MAKVSKPYEQCHGDGTVLTTQPQLRFVHFRSIFCILGLLAFSLQPCAQAPRLAVQAMDEAGNMGPWNSVSVDSSRFGNINNYALFGKQDCEARL